MHNNAAFHAGNYAETNQKVLTLPEDVGGNALELLLQGIYLQEVSNAQGILGYSAGYVRLW